MPSIIVNALHGSFNAREAIVTSSPTVHNSGHPNLNNTLVIF